ASEIQVRHQLWREHAKRVHAFGREIDPPILCCGRDKEHMLLADECDQTIVELLKEVCHAAIIAAPAYTRGMILDMLENHRLYRVLGARFELAFKALTEGVADRADGTYELA